MAHKLTFQTTYHSRSSFAEQLILFEVATLQSITNEVVFSEREDVQLPSAIVVMEFHVVAMVHFFPSVLVLFPVVITPLDM